MEMISKSLEDTAKAAGNFLEILKKNKSQKATLACLYGNLGAGKTAFSQALGKILGVKEGMQSPTFVILKSYDTTDSVFKKFIHIDAYRIEDPKEMLSIGWNELLDLPGTLLAVEWPERIKGILPKETNDIYFEFIDEATRKITFENSK